MSSPAYGEPAYRAMRQTLRHTPTPCSWCGAARATTPDHVPALADHDHRAVGDCCGLVPSCAPCNTRRGAATGNRRRRAGSRARLAAGSGWSS